NGVDIRYLKRVSDMLTSHATIMTDLDDNQIASFYEGAGKHAHESRIEDVREPVSLAIIAPNHPQAMLEYAEACRKQSIPFIADPGQATLALSAKDFGSFLKGAVGLIANDYEWELIQEKTKLTSKKLLEKVGWLIITYAENGSTVWTGNKEFKIPACHVSSVVDPTGCGDAYRAGLMVGISQGKTLEQSARMGAYLGARAVEYNGTQNHRIDPKSWKDFLNSL
ncbi:MAG: PfkB family carbohydrate kinase, partial [Candidatus Peregrinibacteria bacterium]